MGRKSRQNLQEINWNVLVRASQTFAWIFAIASKLKKITIKTVPIVVRTFIILTAITYIYFHANVYYHISMKGENI